MARGRQPATRRGRKPATRRGRQPATQRGGGPPGDWRVFRPAIWLAMVGIALTLLVNPSWVGATVLGASIGVGLRIWRRRRRR